MTTQTFNTSITGAHTHTVSYANTNNGDATFDKGRASESTTNS